MWARGQRHGVTNVGGSRGVRHRPEGQKAVCEADLSSRIEELLGYRFRDPELLKKSLTHASVADTRLRSNERLEFLGDAVLGLSICADLYRRETDWLEGDLTKVKSAVVSRRTCARVADETGLSDLLILGKGIDAHATLPTSLRAAVVESMIGAIYVDGGLEAAQEFVLRAFGPHVEASSASTDQENYKSALQQYAQRTLSSTPRYEALDEQGPDHCKCFEVCVVIGRNRYPSAWGASKKDAEQEAARRALEQLQADEE